MIRLHPSLNPLHEASHVARSSLRHFRHRPRAPTRGSDPTEFVGDEGKANVATADYAKWETLGSGALSPTANGSRTTSVAETTRAELRYRTSMGNGATVRSASTMHNSATTDVGCSTRSRQIPRGGGGRGGRGGAGPLVECGDANRNKVGAVDLRSGTTSIFDDIQTSR